GDRPDAKVLPYQVIALTQPCVVTAGVSMFSPVMPLPPPSDSASGCMSKYESGCSRNKPHLIPACCWALRPASATCSQVQRSDGSDDGGVIPALSSASLL